MRDLAAVDTGVIYCDDNLYRLTQFPAESVDLIYLDPPFFSNRNYEVIWGDEAEVRSFEDRWEGGMNVYVNWMRERVQEMHRILKPTGALYLHCDPHASHYLKVMLDGIFGEANFRNEIVWKRTSAHSSAKRCGPVHDLLFFYSKSDVYTWNPVYAAYDPHYVKTHYTQTDSEGRRWRASDLTALGIRRGSSGESWRGFDVAAKGNHWKFTIANLEQLDEDGRIYWPKKGWPAYKRYLDEMKGTALQDVWTDIAPINAQAQERLGYPTQKPEALLARIIETSSNVGDLVLDPFAGCGTALVAAQLLRRPWIGIDISPTAVHITHRRMLKVGATDVELVGMPTTVDALRALKPFEFQNWAVQRFNGTHASRQVHDFGIDGLSFFHHWPIQVKQSDHVGRNVIDNFETAMERAGKDHGYVVAFSFTRGSYEEAARAKSATTKIIRLVTVAELLESVPDLGLRGDDYAVIPEELPLPVARPADVRPTVEQLIISDRSAA